MLILWKADQEEHLYVWQRSWSKSLLTAYVYKDNSCFRQYFNFISELQFSSTFTSQSNSRDIFELYQMSDIMLFYEMPNIPMRLSDSRHNILVAELEGQKKFKGKNFKEQILR